MGAELIDRRAGRREVIEELLYGCEVLKVAGSLLHQVLVDRGQAGGQRVRDLDGIEVFGEQGAAQREQQVKELGVPFPAKAEQAVVDEVSVLGRAPPPGVGLEDGAELALGQRAGVGGQQAEVDAKALA